MTRVLVTGATGTLGAAVVPRLNDDGFAVRAMSRRVRPGGEWVAADLATGAGLADAVAGVDAVVHLASAPNQGRQMAEVDVEGTRRLVGAAAAAGVRHLLYVSIVGIDRVPLAYYRTKLAAEDVVRHAAVPWTILRATQFPHLLDRILGGASRFGVLLADRAVVAQPVHPRDVAGRIAGRLADGPLGEIEEYGGPQVLRFDEVARQWQQARATRRPVLPLWIPGRIGRQLRAGALTTTAQPTGTLTWGDYLTETYRAAPQR